MIDLDFFWKIFEHFVLPLCALLGAAALVLAKGRVQTWTAPAIEKVRSEALKAAASANAEAVAAQRTAASAVESIERIHLRLNASDQHLEDVIAKPLEEIRLDLRQHLEVQQKISEAVAVHGEALKHMDSRLKTVEDKS